MPPSQEYANEDIIKAIAAIKDGLSFRDAEDFYNVPLSTLKRKMKQSQFEKQVRGPVQTLTDEEEKYLVSLLGHSCSIVGTHLFVLFLMFSLPLKLCVP